MSPTGHRPDWAVATSLALPGLAARYRGVLAVTTRSALLAAPVATRNPKLSAQPRAPMLESAAL